MSDAFDDRGKGFEAKYKNDQEFAFKADARRDKLLGHWLGEKFGMTADEIAAYAKDVVVADLEEPGDEDVVRKVMADIEAHGVDISEAEVRAKLLEFLVMAEQQLVDEA